MAVTVESRRHLVVNFTGVLTENNFFFCLVSTDMCPVVECKYIYLSTTQGTCTLAEHLHLVYLILTLSVHLYIQILLL